MPVVQVGGHRRKPEAGIVLLRYRRQRIDIAGHLRSAVVGLVRWARAARAGAIVKPPNGL